MPLKKLECGRSPADVLADWPETWPLAVLWSDDAGADARWTILARPGQVTRTGAQAGTTGGVPIVPKPGSSTKERAEGDALPPFRGGWIGFLSYDLGARLEPSVANPQLRTPAPWPLAEWHRCDHALVFDHARNQWWGIGGLTPPGPARPPQGEHFRLSRLRSTTGRAGYVHAVRRALEYIRAGDVYQVNLAHELTGAFEGSARDLFASLILKSRPWHGAYLESFDESPVRAIVSLSPELFLDFDPATRRVRTRPMKGTRPGAASTRELDDSPKDRAELAMIVDLMRNDLGRVCAFGSVRVDEARRIERHGGRRGVLQATATVSGTLREERSLQDLICAAFPGGSVTGAPKIRAMQIIDELEPVARGPYCGAIGFVSDSGHAAFNIAIRTALIEGGAGPLPGQFRGATLRYSVGAGIVADSAPDAEWRETLQKARAIGAAVQRSDPSDRARPLARASAGRDPTKRAALR